MKGNLSKFKNTILLVTYIIVLTFVLFNYKSTFSIGRNALHILSPFLLGFAMAFVLNLPMKIFEKRVFFFLDNHKSNFVRSMKRPLSILFTLIVITCLLVALFMFVIPQFIDSVSILLKDVPGYIRSLESWVSEYINSTEILQSIANYLLDAWQDLLKVTGQILGTSLSGILDITVNITSGIVDFVLSLFLAIYMLASKETLIRNLKKFLYAFLNKRTADKIINVGQISNVTFASFITGQCTEAVIIGVLCFIGMLILRMPYALLISVLVGSTALIPIFGAFIGTIPSAFIIFIIDPWKSLGFIIFIIVLQQFEGNVIYPRVVGGSIGLSGLWVMLAMLIGGSTLGFIGMLLGIPMFAVIYKLLGKSTNDKLKDKGISL